MFSKLTLCLILSSTVVVGCTSGSSDSPSIVGSITDGINDIISPDPSINEAKIQISEIQSDLNKNKAYALTDEDVNILKTEGLLSQENEIKGWVK